MIIRGTTFIYGHGTDAVFGKIGSSPPPSGTIAEITTDNGHVFTYVLQAVKNYEPSDTSVLQDTTSGQPASWYRRALVHLANGARCLYLLSRRCRCDSTVLHRWHPLIAVVVGVTLHDIRVIRAQRATSCIPTHANGEQGHYRGHRLRPKCVVAPPLPQCANYCHGERWPNTPHTRAAQLPSGSLHSAVRFHAVYPKRPVPLFPVIATPATIRQLFGRPICSSQHPLPPCGQGLACRRIVIFRPCNASATGRHSFTVATWTAKCVLPPSLATHSFWV